MIDEFLHKRIKVDFVEPNQAITASIWDFQPFKKDWLFTHKKLIQVDCFMRRRRKELCMEDGKIG